jgi:DNA invertase Pin-like site-specific DNA recombinase
MFYGRVSTKEQNKARQLIKAQESGILEENIYVDEQTGTNFIRPKYKEMLNKFRKDDKLYVQKLDRFGRNYDEIKHQISEIEKNGVELEFLNMPVIKTGDLLTDKLLQDQFINTLSYVAQKEIEKRKKRQDEGIKICLATGKTKTGKAYGRPKQDNIIKLQKCYEMKINTLNTS